MLELNFCHKLAKNKKTTSYLSLQRRSDLELALLASASRKIISYPAFAITLISD